MTGMRINELPEIATTQGSSKIALDNNVGTNWYTSSMTVDNLIKTVGSSGILRQAIDNAQFQVDQYGLLSSTPLIVINDYMIDRWELLGSVAEMRASIADEVLRLESFTAGTVAGISIIRQKVPSETIKVLKRSSDNVIVSVKIKSNNSFANMKISQTSLAAQNVFVSGVVDEILSITIPSANLYNDEDLIIEFNLYDSGGVDITLGDYIEISEPKLSIGTVVLPTEPRLYSVELAECQRYAVDILGEHGGFGEVGTGIAATGTTSVGISIPLPAGFRAPPSLGAISGTFRLTDEAYTETITSSNMAIFTLRNSQHIAKITVSGVTLPSTYRMYKIEAADDTSSRFMLDANL